MTLCASLALLLSVLKTLSSVIVCHVGLPMTRRAIATCPAPPEFCQYDVYWYPLNEVIVLVSKELPFIARPYAALALASTHAAGSTVASIVLVIAKSAAKASRFARATIAQALLKTAVRRPHALCLACRCTHIRIVL